VPRRIKRKGSATSGMGILLFLKMFSRDSKYPAFSLKGTF
jgi:hypothetical protein